MTIFLAQIICLVVVSFFLQGEPRTLKYFTLATLPAAW